MLLKHKKAVSEMIGYVLIIAMIIIIAPIVYSWLKSYASEGTIPECNSDTSILIKNYFCNTTSWNLTLTISNNGFFTTNGFSIKATTSPEQDLATLDLSETFVISSGKNTQDGVVFATLNPGESFDFVFDLKKLTSAQTRISSIELTPVLKVEVNNKEELAYCENSRIKQEILNCVKT